jgi:hypothetical protein
MLRQHRSRFGYRTSLINTLQAVGHYAAFITVVPVAEMTVKAMLPAGLELAEQHLFPGAVHPLLFLFGQQNRVHLRGVDLLGMTYLEAAVIVPYIKPMDFVAGRQVPYVYLSRMYLNKPLPIFLGLFYGFPKQRASMGRSETSYVINDLTAGQTLMAGDFRPVGAAAAPDAFPEFAAGLLQLFAKAVIVGKSPLGPFIYSIPEHDLATAWVQGIEADLQVSAAFAPGLPPATYRDLPSLKESRSGAFLIDTSWRLSLPFVEPKRLIYG